MISFFQTSERGRQFICFSLMALLSLLGVSCSTLGGGGEIPVTLHLQAGGYDSKNLVFPGVLPGTSKRLYFRKLPEISQKQMVAFFPFLSESDQRLGSIDTLKPEEASYGAVFVLNKEGRRRLKDLSLANMGKYLVARVNATTSDYLYISEPVTDGLLVVWQGLSPEWLNLLSKKMKRLTSYPQVNQSGVVEEDIRYNAEGPEQQGDDWF